MIFYNGRSCERIWRGKFYFPRDLFAYFRATLFFSSVPWREPWFKATWRVPHRTISYARLGCCLLVTFEAGSCFHLFLHFLILFQSVWTFWEAAFLRALQIHPDKVCSGEHPSFSTRTGVFSFVCLVHSNPRLVVRRVWIGKGDPYEVFHCSKCVISEKSIRPK